MLRNLNVARLTTTEAATSENLPPCFRRFDNRAQAPVHGTLGAAMEVVEMKFPLIYPTEKGFAIRFKSKKINDVDVTVLDLLVLRNEINRVLGLRLPYDPKDNIPDLPEVEKE